MMHFIVVLDRELWWRCASCSCKSIQKGVRTATLWSENEMLVVCFLRKKAMQGTWKILHGTACSKKLTRSKKGRWCSLLLPLREHPKCRRDGFHCWTKKWHFSREFDVSILKSLHLARGVGFSTSGYTACAQVYFVVGRLLFIVF